MIMTMMFLIKVTNEDDDGGDLGLFQGSRDNWMTGEAEIPATLAFLDIGADISYFHHYIFPLLHIDAKFAVSIIRYFHKNIIILF